jgi:hypothetical protein
LSQDMTTRRVDRHSLKRLLGYERIMPVGLVNTNMLWVKGPCFLLPSERCWQIIVSNTWVQNTLWIIVGICGTHCG